MLRNAGLNMQPSAIAVNVSPAPANSTGSEISATRLPAIAADSGPRPREVNISTLIVRPIIAGATRHWIQLTTVICANLFHERCARPGRCHSRALGPSAVSGSRMTTPTFWVVSDGVTGLPPCSGERSDRCLADNRRSVPYMAIRHGARNATSPPE